MLIDYALVSTRKAVCQRTFTDKTSGTESDRPGLAEALSRLRVKDVLVVWKLDRLGRTVKGLVDLVGELSGCDVQFRSLTDGIDTTTAGRFIFPVMALLAQIERELIAERTKAGLATARKRGRVGGRKRHRPVRSWLGGMPPEDVTRKLGVSIPTRYRWVPAANRS